MYSYLFNILILEYCNISFPTSPASHLPHLSATQRYAHHFGADDQSSDWYLEPTSAWQIALDAASPTFKNKAGYANGAAPFNHTGWPSVITATVRDLPTWGMASNSATVPPASPACTAAGSTCGSPRQVELVPHGGTDLRIGEMPLSGK